MSDDKIKSGWWINMTKEELEKAKATIEMMKNMLSKDIVTYYDVVKKVAFPKINEKMFLTNEEEIVFTQYHLALSLIDEIEEQYEIKGRDINEVAKTSGNTHAIELIGKLSKTTENIRKTQPRFKQFKKEFEKAVNTKEFKSALNEAFKKKRRR